VLEEGDLILVLGGRNQAKFNKVKGEEDDTGRIIQKD
jgi:hypothetical protein